MKQYLLFDLDGTLTDPKVGICTCVQYALASFGIDEPDLDKLEPFIGPPLKYSFMKYYQLTEEQAETAVEKYRERFSEIGIFENKLYDGIVPMLIALNSAGLHLAVASSKPQVYVERILQHFNIARYFGVIVGSELDGTRVNKSEIVEEALRRLFGEQPIDRRQVYMIGDRSYDAEGARKAHVESVCVTYGYGSMEELKTAKADYIVRSVEELQNFLLRGVGERERVTPTQRIMQICLPFLLYIFVRGIAANVMKMLFQILGNTIPWGDFLFVRDEQGNVASLTGNGNAVVQIVSALAGVAALSKIARKTFKRANESNKLLHIKKDPPKTYAFLAVASLGAVIGLNLFMNLSGMISFSENYQLVEKDQFSANLLLGILCYGIVTAFAEEVLFRGIIYNCLKRSMAVKMAIVLSAMVFSVYHGNAVQGIYAFLLGCIITYAYEYFGDFRIPVLIHMLANTLVYCLSSTGLGVTGFVSWPVCLVALGLAGAGLYLMHKEKKAF